MTVLVGPTRYSRSNTEVIADLIAWQRTGEGSWVGSIDLDLAGKIVADGAGFVATDWKGDVVGEFRTLRQAQEALEPRRRMALRDRAERAAQRVQWLIAGCATVLSALTLALVVNGVLSG